MAMIRIVEEDLNRDGKVTFGERVASAGMMAGALLVALQVVYLAVCLLLDVAGWAFWWDVYLGLSLLVAAVSWVGLIVWRMTWHERAERLEGAERRRRWAREDFEFAQLRGVVETEAGTRITQAQIDAAAQLYLKRYYEGRGLARAGWLKDGYSKELWDTVNGLMKKRGIRKGRGDQLVQESFAEAWGVWCEAKLKNRQWLRADEDEFVEAA